MRRHGKEGNRRTTRQLQTARMPLVLRTRQRHEENASGLRQMAQNFEPQPTAKSVIGETILRRRHRYFLKEENVPSVIVRSMRKSDKEHGRSGFDLDTEFVRGLISDGCAYCGAKDIRMTLDRIDNGLGHAKTNVNPACVRCNHVRGSMPYEAWSVLVPAVRRAYESGLFGKWWMDTRKNNKPKLMFEYTDATSHGSLLEDSAESTEATSA